MKLKHVFQIITLLSVVFLAGCKKDDVGIRPTVTGTSPINQSTGTLISTTVTATFSIAMNPATITSTRFTVTKAGSPVAGVVTYSGVTATFTPTAALSPNALFTATITTGAQNMSGVSIIKDYVWTFTTGGIPDVTAPTVTATSPANNATGVAMSSLVTVTFSEAMDVSTITALTFTLKQGVNAVAGAVSYAGSVATFTPTTALLGSTVYTATVTTGSKDVAGNSLAANHVSTFTTAAAPDTTPPTVNSTDPIAAATGVILSKVVVVNFSEPMTSSTVNGTTFTLMQGANAVAGTVSYTGNAASFTPTNPLTASTVYTATVTTGVKDLAANALAANLVFSFTTGTVSNGLAVVNLGSSINYLILAKSAITNISTSAITGDLGLSPAATSYVTGLGLTNATGYATSAQVTGKIYAADMADPTPITLTTAVNDMETAYTDAAGRPTPDFSELGTGNIGGMTLTPGLYKWSTSVTIPTNVTISGGPNDVWIFQMSGDLTMSSAVNMTLIGGAQAKNIFWQVAGQATMGTTSHFEGIILSQTGITFQTGASLNGRAMAQTAVILDSSTMVKP